jgi:hypothetical protein
MQVRPMTEEERLNQKACQEFKMKILQKRQPEASPSISGPSTAPEVVVVNNGM